MIARTTLAQTMSMGKTSELFADELAESTAKFFESSFAGTSSPPSSYRIRLLRTESRLRLSRWPIKVTAEFGATLLMHCAAEC